MNKKCMVSYVEVQNTDRYFVFHKNTPVSTCLGGLFFKCSFLLFTVVEIGSEESQKGPATVMSQVYDGSKQNLDNHSQEILNTVLRKCWVPHIDFMTGTFRPAEI